ncbi:MAG: hypothetical protein ACK493_01225 [Planctomycetota bacterium]|jgi:uncharacterized protein with von Willebrand factor type A (vWA) domain
MSSKRKAVGGVVHTYQKYDPQKFPSPTAPPVDLVSPMMERMLAFGNARPLSEEELARAVRLDPSQFRLGPSLDLIRAMLLERKRRILETYETETVQQEAKRVFEKRAKTGPQPPDKLRKAYKQAVEEEQLVDLEQVWYLTEDDTSPFARHVVNLMERLGDKYQVDELAAKYNFTGRDSMTIPQALEIKEELEKIDDLLKQVDQAEQNAQIGYIDLEELSEFVEPGDIEQLEEMQRMIDNYVKEQAERQGLESVNGQFRLTPKALRVFQGKLLGRIFSDLKAGRTGRHAGNIVGEGAVELEQTKPYEFGDSVTNMDLPQSFINSLVRNGPGLPLRLGAEDIVIHRTRNNPKAATVVIMDMSGSMRYDGQYINVKRMALALDGLIRSEYPGDYLGFVEMYSFAKVRTPAEIIELMPKPVTLHQPVVQLRFDMSSPRASEHMVHPHFTNMQHALNLARRLLSVQNTPNRQIIVITDGLPTAHFEENQLYLLYPPHPVTEQATLREAQLCGREGITINMFLVPSWSQTEEDVKFAQRLAEGTKGRVFFTGGEDLDRFVVWDYVRQRREILG